MLSVFLEDSSTIEKFGFRNYCFEVQLNFVFPNINLSVFIAGVWK